MKRFFALMLAVLIVAGLLYGCGSNETAQDAGNGTAMDKLGSSAEIAPEEDGLTSTSTNTNISQTPANQKLVHKIWINGETEDLDTLLQQVDQKIDELSGYAESREVYNGSSNATRRYRRASLTIRIPATQLDLFVNHVTELSNITSSNETADDITLTYIATQSRVSALQTEHDRLLELLAKAETMRDLLEIEARLTEVRADLEEVTSKLKLYDNMVDYGTVYLELSEVKEYTDISEPETVWERIGKGFTQSLSNLGDFFVELFVIVVVGLPYIALIAVIVTGVSVLLKLRKRKQKKSNRTDSTEG